MAIRNATSARQSDSRCGRLSRFLLAVILSSLTMACASDRHVGPEPAFQDCLRQGGTIRPVCLTQEPMCVIPYPDAGRPCRDGDDCAGDCLATAAAKQGEPATGVCQSNNDPCGCRTYIEDGRIAHGLCID